MTDENLGTAVLRIEVDDTLARNTLNKLRQDIDQTTRTASTGTSSTGRAGGKPSTDARQKQLENLFAQREQRLRSLELSVFSAQESRLKATRNAAKGGGGGRLGAAISSGIIGGAFPLLFGQGGGAAAGGLAGGLIGGALGGGGGFAGSLAGTLIGQQLDVFNQLAKALEDPVANFKQLVETSNLSSKGLEKYIQTLIDLGQTAEAESLIRRDLSRTIDPTTLATTNAVNEQYARTLADVQERLGAILAGPASKFISWLDEIIRRSGLLPGLGQGPAPADAQNRLGIAQRGAGTALGLGGIGIAALGVAAAPFTAGASLLPAAIAGGGLAAAGAFQTQVGASLQDQAGSAELLKGVQQEILAIEQKRITLQRQLVTGGKRSEDVQAELQLQVDLADLETKRAKAKESFFARGLSTESFQAYKLELDNLNLVETQLKRNNDIRKQAVEEQKRLAQIQSGIEASQSALNIQGIEQRRENVLALQGTPAGVGRDRLAVQQAAAFANDQARRREQSLRDQISAAQQRGGDTGAADAAGLTNQLNEAIAETALVAEEGKLSLQEFNENARQQAFDDLSKAIEESAKQAQQAADAFKAAQDRYTAAQQGLRSARESAFQFLSGSDQRQLVSAARSDIREAGFRNTRGLSDTEILSVGGLARNLTAAESELTLASNNVATALDKLADKNWAVNVAVSGAQAAVSGDVLNGAISP